jgi:hypothetical protein
VIAQKRALKTLQKPNLEKKRTRKKRGFVLFSESTKKEGWIERK